jgi:diguanylate cyclase (GGDEF)-like protein/PAS domain S-box-containing protein
MRPDLKTILLLLVVFNILQTCVFILIYLLDRERRGSREWILWSVSLTAGFLLIFFRNAVPQWLFRPTVALSNACIIAGHLFLYVGIERFLEIKPGKYFIIGITGFFILGSFVAIAVFADGNLSSTIFFLSLAMIIGSMAVSLWRKSLACIRGSARFLATLFFIQSGSLFFRSVLAFTVSRNLSFFESSAPQLVLFLAPLCMGYLWSISIIVMLNHAKVSEYREARVNQQLIFNTHPDAVWVTSFSDGHIEDLNDGFTRITGYEREDAIGRTSLELGLWKDAADRARLLKEVGEKGVSEESEASFITKEGAVKHGIVSSRKIEIRGEEKVVAVMHDITARNEMENALKESEEKFRMLVENSYDIIYTLDPKGVFTFVSPVWTRLLGHEPEEVVGKSYRSFIHPEDIPACKEFLEKMIATGERQTGVEYRTLHKKGYWLWHTSSSVPFFAEDGSIQGFYGIDRDITERRSLQKDLEQQATTDELTGITNRRHFLSLAQAELKRSRRMKRDLTLALIDVDHFKEINDSWGHGVGDQALVFFTVLIRAHIRDMDILARFGGDEFVILFPETSTEHAAAALERLRTALERTPFDAVRPPVTLSVSAGITCALSSPPDKEGGDTIDSILFRADKALYMSKGAGRKRISIM